MNKLIVTGRLTRDPEVKQTTTGALLALMTVAVRRSYKDKESGRYESDFFQFKAFDGIANVIEAYFKKGALIEVEGSVSNSNYEKDGKTVYKNDFIANRVNILSPPKSQYGESPYQENEPAHDDSEIPF